MMFQPFGQANIGELPDNPVRSQEFASFEDTNLISGSDPKKKPGEKQSLQRRNYGRKVCASAGDSYVDKSNETKELSVHEFRNKMYARFKQNGMIDSLKTQMRVQILSQMQREGNLAQPSNLVLEKDGDVVRRRNLWSQAINGMIAHHLQKTSCTYTLSVFVSEANLRETAQMGDIDLLSMIGVTIANPDNILQIENTNFGSRKLGEMYRKETQDESVLSKMVKVFQSIISQPTHSIEVQTEKSASSIDNELQKLDENFLFELEQYKKNSVLSLEQRFIEYQSECEKRAREEIASKVRMFEDTVVSTMRLQESAKYREKVSQIRDDLEKSYLRKMERLSLRERQIMYNLELKAKNFDKELYEHRQSMFREVEKVQVDRAMLQKEILEVEEKKRIIQKLMEQQTKDRETKMSQLTYEMREELNIQKERLEKEYSERNEELRQKSEELEREKKKIETIKGDACARETLKETQQALNAVKTQLEETRTRNRFLETHSETLSQQVQKLRETRLELTYVPVHKTDINQILERKVTDLTEENRKLSKGLDEATKHIEQLKEFHREEISSLEESFINKMRTEKENFRKFAYQLQNEKRLGDLEILDYEKIEQELEESNLKQKDMILEIENLRHMLGETQSALDAALNGSLHDNMYLTRSNNNHRDYSSNFYRSVPYSWKREDFDSLSTFSSPEIPSRKSIMDVGTMRSKDDDQYYSEPKPVHKQRDQVDTQIEPNDQPHAEDFRPELISQLKNDIQLPCNPTERKDIDADISRGKGLPDEHDRVPPAGNRNEDLATEEKENQKTNNNLHQEKSLDGETMGRQWIENHEPHPEEEVPNKEPEILVIDMKKEDDRLMEEEVIENTYSEPTNDNAQGHTQPIIESTIEPSRIVDTHDEQIQNEVFVDSDPNFSFDNDDEGFNNDTGFDSDNIYVETVDAYDDW